MEILLHSICNEIRLHVISLLFLWNIFCVFLTGCSVFSRLDEGAHLGKVCSMSWTPDGNALGTIWSKCGVAVWSVFGSLLMCVESSDFG